MLTPEFQAFSKIERLDRLWMTITQKIHGTNGQIYIELEDHKWLIKAGSRTRWLTTEDDNYGFAKWVQDNAVQLITKLGVGRHYGEWCGAGINNGEGLSGKMFVLFDWFRYAEAMKDGEISSYPYLMEGLRVVPVLYKGHYSDAKVQEVMDDLKTDGSHLTPPGWFMKPEGIVIDINGNKYKRVFDAEETGWKSKKRDRAEKAGSVDVSHLLQPIRLEKLVSQDERYRREYPESLKTIVQAYKDDLIAESQFDVNDKVLTKSLGKQLFPFVKHFMETLR